MKELTVTCLEARKLLDAGKAVKVHWRPDMKQLSKTPDNDPAIVWVGGDGQ